MANILVQNNNYTKSLKAKYAVNAEIIDEYNYIMFHLSVKH